MSAGGNTCARLVMAAAFLLLANPPVPVRADATGDPQIVYGPLMLALDASYQKWIAANGASPPDTFQARFDGTNDPYVVRFEATSGHHVVGATYAVAEATVLDYTLGAAPSWWDMQKGPYTMSGAYVTAFDAALQYRRTNPPNKQLAQLGSDASFAVVRKKTFHERNYYWVAMDQMLVGTWSRNLYAIGCDIQQNYFVDATTSAVTYEPFCFPA